MWSSLLLFSICQHFENETEKHTHTHGNKGEKKKCTRTRRAQKIEKSAPHQLQQSNNLHSLFFHTGVCAVCPGGGGSPFASPSTVVLLHKEKGYERAAFRIHIISKKKKSFEDGPRL